MNAMSPQPIIITPDFVPQSEADLLLAAQSWEWRIFSGRFYKILIKGDDETEGLIAPFFPNAAQSQFMDAIHYRNVILKARQLGFTTLISILWLDHALFNANQRCAIIAHEVEAAEAIFKDKVRFAYENLPDLIRQRMPLSRDSAKEIRFGHNNSAIRVATSVRSGTYQRLHVSEMGKIAAKYPQKAEEIVTGSFPTVPANGILIIESTAEGQDGKFYDIASRAEKLHQMRKRLSKAQYRFHFFPWMDAPEYQVDPRDVTFTTADQEYFDKLERMNGRKIGIRQRAWYVTKRENDFSGDQEIMWREFPSTPAECWQKSTEGTWFAEQMSRVRKEGRITTIPHVTQVRVNTFWDIGARDGTGIWLHQLVGTQHRFLRYFEDWGKGYSHYIRMLRETGWIFGGMFLPHDAASQRQMADTIAAPLDMLMELAPDWNWIIVPKVETYQHGIDLTRAKFSEAWFDEKGCAAGIVHLDLHRKKRNVRLGVWSDEPEKLSGHSEGADAFRQWAQGFDPSFIQAQQRPRRRVQGGMAI